MWSTQSLRPTGKQEHMSAINSGIIIVDRASLQICKSFEGLQIIIMDLLLWTLLVYRSLVILPLSHSHVYVSNQSGQNTKKHNTN